MEIEFKTSIEKDKYLELLELFDLEENIYKQTNYYFDTEDFTLSNNKTVLRIRQKGVRFKVTLKSKSKVGPFKNNVLIDKNKEKDIIKIGLIQKHFLKISIMMLSF